MKQTIRQVLDDMKDSQINLGSFAARETMAKLITTALKSKGNYTEFQTGESYSNINDKGEESAKETIRKIGDYLEEILEMNDEQIKDELND